MGKWTLSILIKLISDLLKRYYAHKGGTITQNSTIQVLADLYSQFHKTIWNATSSQPAQELEFDNYFEFVSDFMMNISVSAVLPTDSGDSTSVRTELIEALSHNNHE